MENNFEEFKKAVLGKSRSLSFSINPPLTKRWLENDSEVELSLRQKFKRNAEFFVNGKTNHCIWFSQLSEPFLKVSTLELVLGKIIKKDGSIIYMNDMNNTQFIEYVKNKRFKVIANAEGDCVKMAKEVGYMTPNQWQERIMMLLREQKHNEAAQLIEPANLYSLKEL